MAFADPNPEDPFEGPKAKIERARELIAEMEALAQAFVSDGGFADPVVSQDPETGAPTVSVGLAKPFPRGVRTRPADAIYNLRSALDGALSRCIVLSGRSARGCQFPHGENLDAFRRSMKDGCHRAPPAIKAAIGKLEVYPGGKGAILRALHQWNLQDKHSDLLTASMRMLDLKFDARGIPLLKLAEEEDAALMLVGMQPQTGRVTVGITLHSVDPLLDGLSVSQALLWAAHRVEEVVTEFEGIMQKGPASG